MPIGCLVAAFMFAPEGSAGAAGSSEFTVLTPPPSPPLAPRLPALAAPPDLTPFLGQRVLGVDVVVEDSPLRPPPLRAITSVRAGEALSPFSARRVLDEVLEWGLFGDGWVNVVTGDSGVHVRVHVRPRFIVDGLVIDTHGGAIGVDDLLREAGLDEGSEFVGNELDTRADRMRALLARRGYPDAVVRVTARPTDAPTRAVVLIDVSPAAPRKIERRVFYTFGAAAADLHRLTARYALDRGDRVDEPALDSADDELVGALRGAGYHDADVVHDVVLASGMVTLRVRIDSGPKYALQFVGNEHYDRDALRAAALGESDGADLSDLQLEARIARFYEVRGFLDVAVTTETRDDPNKQARALVFHVREGERVRVTSRSYPCLKTEEIAKLTGGGPATAAAVGREIDSFLEEDLPGADLLVSPSQEGVDALFSGASGARVEPIDLDPNTVYAASTYERAVAHVQELYRAEGYLAAMVGPVEVLRRPCDPKSGAGRCDAAPLRSAPAFACTYDASGLPLAAPAAPAFAPCTPDPARGLLCEASVSLRVPIKLGPRSFVYDLAFKGAASIDETRLAAAAAVQLGEPVSSVSLDQARRRVLDLYKEEGFAYADVAFALEKSPDQTRARVRFDITEGVQVIIRHIHVRGNDLTSESAIRRRVALEIGQPYRTSAARKTQERVATLNVFSSVNVAMSNPLVPEADKTVVVTVTEVKPQYIELRPGFSTGEGARGAFEYGHKNLFGSAVGASLRAQLSYLPDFLILDPTIAANFKTLSAAERLAARVTATMAFPEVGLGPLVRASLDGVVLQDPERYFTILKQAAIPTLYYRPARQVQLSVGLGVEHNNLFVFNDRTPAEAIAATGGNYDVAKLLRAPSGDSVVASQRFTVAWDRRDSPYNARKGTYVAGSVEHDDAFATQEASNGHFVRLAQTFSAYVPVGPKASFAATLRLGEIIQLASNSVTYPDRFFFMGGFDSMRGWAQDTLFPQDAVDAIASSRSTAHPIDPSTIAVRGGNLMINPRAELRLPLFGPLETVLFVDLGNLWQDARYPFDHGFRWRVASGSGLRLQTPVGPLALDYGINLTRVAAYEDFGALNFSIGLF